MADKPQDGPSLEMPSFSLRRKRKPAPAPGLEGAPDPQPEPDLQPQPDPQPEPEPQPEPVADPSHREPRRMPAVTVGGLPAAALVGLLVGGLALALAWLAGAGCEAVRGTSSCGGAVGLPILLAVLVLLAYVGTLLLRLAGVDAAASTSLLAVGVLAVLVMVFLLGTLDEWWSRLAVPVASAVAYAGSWWVTTSVAAEGTEVDAPVPHDVR